MTIQHVDLPVKTMEGLTYDGKDLFLLWLI